MWHFPKGWNEFHHTVHKVLSLVHLLWISTSPLASLTDGTAGGDRASPARLLPRAWCFWRCRGHFYRSGSTGHLASSSKGLKKKRRSGFSKPSHPSQTAAPVHPDRGWFPWSPSLVLPRSRCSSPQWCRSWLIVKLKTILMIFWNVFLINVIFTIFVINEAIVSVYYRLSFKVNI